MHDDEREKLDVSVVTGTRATVFLVNGVQFEVRSSGIAVGEAREGGNMHIAWGDAKPGVGYLRQDQIAAILLHDD